MRNYFMVYGICKSRTTGTVPKSPLVYVYTLAIGIPVIYTAVMIFSFILSHNIEEEMDIYYSQFL